MVDLFVGEPFVNIRESVFGCCKFQCFMFFVDACVEVVDCSIVCTSGLPVSMYGDGVGYMNVWCGVWYDDNGTFVSKLVCDFVAGDTPKFIALWAIISLWLSEFVKQFYYILDNDSMWGPSHQVGYACDEEFVWCCCWDDGCRLWLLINKDVVQVVNGYEYVVWVIFVAVRVVKMNYLSCR